MSQNLSIKEKLFLITDLANTLDVIFRDELTDNFDELELLLQHQLIRLCRSIDRKEINKLENNLTQS